MFRVKRRSFTELFFSCVYLNLGKYGYFRTKKENLVQTRETH